MNTLIPIEFYTPVYFHFMLFIVFMVFVQSSQSKLESDTNLSTKSAIGLFLLFAIIFYMGLRPISFTFGDMGIYAIEFKEFINGKIPEYKSDILFEFLMYNFSKLGSAPLFFFFCAILYVVPLFIVSKAVFKDYWFYCFLMLVASFSFWAFGTNGIRNGIATSLFLLAITRQKLAWQIVIFICAVLIHKSLTLLIIAFVLVKYFKNPKMYFAIWFLAIPLSLALGGFWENFFLGLGFGEETKLDAYLGQFDAVSESVEIKVGFRWDFLLYSATGVFAAWYYIFKKNYQDEFYLKIVNMYLVMNGLWILVIRSNYSNRFAYLSWFMLALVILYPMLKNKIVENQHNVIGKIILYYFLLTYLLNVIFE